ncbi:MAG: cytidine deaminase [Clostridiales bacterium]|nr:cytidine deaminase [Clostridiales bacterium]
MPYSDLILAALDARKKAYCPYSGFAVGAALLAEDGKIYTGCNIESATYSPTNCAERTAFFKAVSEGVKTFQAIAIVGGKLGENELETCPPCGVCRQVMAEFCLPSDFKVILGKSPKDYIVKTLAELLPLSFGADHLGSDIK